MIEFITRLFIVLPLKIIHFCCAVTIIIPLFYWVITGNDWRDLAVMIENLEHIFD